MMPPSKILAILALLAFAQTGLAYAQNTTTTGNTNPPKLEPIDDVNDTPITVTAKPAQKNSIEEHKEQGRVTEVKVTSGPSTYYLKPNNQQESGIPGRNVSGPQWRIMEFGGKKKTVAEDEPDAAPVPPPPSLPQTK